MAAPAPSWNTCHVVGTWHGMDGAPRPGSYKVTLPVRVTNATDDVIIPAGVFATGSLNVTPGVPSLDLEIPANDDPDNSPNGWQVVIEVTFTNAAGEKYVIDTPVDGEVNLRAVVLAASIPSAQTVLIRGVPGGLAELDADGDVVDATGAKVIASADVDLSGYATDADLATVAGSIPTTPGEIGAQPAGSYAAAVHTHTASQVSDATTTGRAVMTAASAAAARTAIGAGTSSLALGTASTTAKAGDWQPVIVSADAVPGNAISTGSDGGAFLDVAQFAPPGTYLEQADLDLALVNRPPIWVIEYIDDPAPAGSTPGDLLLSQNPGPRP